ncbi:TfoX/Sxy family transcriptional regulator of competence genes [Rhodococcus wratislaviensis]|uniref:Regulator of competence-specific genes n=1 Tax=Rhodococcus wratislaviensis TaxID=44752 RepID=A0AB38FKH4_RHOWR|nr:TfoX/Sxy family protein [Rhodococcus wratislaviensis]REE74371.1 TfoX/Sxy family transcriptional regulator of competence genes [Rhodococcus wratislaviensis]SPZ42092.1 Regulator of competence-specific genes [Rhodococcus wratislaviensis]
MKMPKPSEEDKQFFRSLIPDVPGVEVKPMFGNLGAFVNGNMFAGLLGPKVGVRLLTEQARDELASSDGAGPFGPGEKPMREYLALPDRWRGTPDRATPWVERALAEIAALPPKQPKPRKK